MTSPRPAAVARTLTGAGTVIALIGMVTGFQVAGTIAEQQAQADAQVQAAEATGTHVRGQAVRVLDPSLLPEIVVAPPVAVAPVSSGSSAPAAPAAPAPSPAQPAPPADGNTGGSGG